MTDPMSSAAGTEPGRESRPPRCTAILPGILPIVRCEIDSRYAGRIRHEDYLDPEYELGSLHRGLLPSGVKVYWPLEKS